VEDSLEFVENSASAMQESTYSLMGWVMGIIPVDSPSHRGVFNWDEDKRRSISVGSGNGVAVSSPRSYKSVQYRNRLLEIDIIA